MNQAVQQKKVASIVSQLQNTGSAPNLTSSQVISTKAESKTEKQKNIENTATTIDLVTFDDVSNIL